MHSWVGLDSFRVGPHQFTPFLDRPGPDHRVQVIECH